MGESKSLVKDQLGEKASGLRDKEISEGMNKEE
jgi:hypothetical protein